MESAASVMVCVTATLMKGERNYFELDAFVIYLSAVRTLHPAIRRFCFIGSHVLSRKRVLYFHKP